MSENVRLTRNQRRALAALIEHATITDAAQACGLSEKTLARYRNLPEFKRALVEAEGNLLDNAARRLLAGQGRALDRLESLISDAAKDNDQRLAAQAWLDFGLRYRELINVENRLASLEAAIFYGNGDKTD